MRETEAFRQKCLCCVPGSCDFFHISDKYSFSSPTFTPNKFSELSENFSKPFWINWVHISFHCLHNLQRSKTFNIHVVSFLLQGSCSKNDSNTRSLSPSSSGAMALKALEKSNPFYANAYLKVTKWCKSVKSLIGDSILKSKLLPNFCTAVKIQRGKGNIQFCSLYPVTLPLR